MKSFILTFSAIIAALTTFAAQPTSTNYQVASGSLRYHPQFQSQYVPPRNVVVWLPDSYPADRHYDVIYMHDGQMLFDANTSWNHQEWQVDEVIGNLIQKGTIRPCIVVGIDNTDNRLGEYFPQKLCRYLNPKHLAGIDTTLFAADNYLRFLTRELKPFIDSHYLTHTGPEHTFTLGSSMGGLISFYAICEYPHIFGGAACMSTHLSFIMPQAPGTPAFNNKPWAEAFRKYISKNLPKPNSHLLYMDRGTVELDGTYQPYQDAITRLIISKGWDTQHFTARTFIGHKHMETYWAARLATPITFLLHP